MNSLVVLDPGPLTTVQDRGRPGWAHLGVPRAGALDRPAAALANRLVGNVETAAVLETTVGGVELRVRDGCWAALTGADGAAYVDARPVGRHQPVWLPAESVLRVGPALQGVRTYVAFQGGVEAESVLGSQSTDTLAGVGPSVLRAGTVLRVGKPTGAPRMLPAPAVRRRSGVLRIHRGPRSDWLAPGAWESLLASAWMVGADSNRVGLRLTGPLLERRAGEIASEGMPLGAVQLPPSGQPVVFLADHPVTGGYPVVGVVDTADLWIAAQAAPGETLRFTPAR